MTGSTRSSALAEFLAAVSFLTRLPVPGPAAWNPAIHGRSMAWYPFVGLLLGIAGAVLYRIATGLGMPDWPAAVATIAALLWLTGAVHAAGLADFADAMAGVRPSERWLALLPGRRLGGPGAAVLVLSQALRVSFVALLAEPRPVLLALVGALAASHGFLALLAGLLPPSGSDRLFASLGGPGRARALAAGLIGASLSVTAGYRLGGPNTALLAPLVGLAATWLVGRFALHRQGGLTGDALGAAQQAAEIFILLLFLLRLP